MTKGRWIVGLLSRSIAALGVLVFVAAPWHSWDNLSFGFGDRYHQTGLDTLRGAAERVLHQGFVLPILADQPASRPGIEDEMVVALWISFPLAAMALLVVPSSWERLRLLAATAWLASVITIACVSLSVWPRHGSVPFFAMPELFVPGLICAALAAVLLSRRVQWAATLLLGLEPGAAVIFSALVAQYAGPAAPIALLLAAAGFWLECLAWSRDTQRHADPDDSGLR
ncbi:MAG TPA: hypothetical protein VFF73_02825 [Planctomycetota bacterium]|nr:hypothetical protein [Planctomycetota bacterium]